jgi:hypothetical protein
MRASWVVVFGLAACSADGTYRQESNSHLLPRDAAIYQAPPFTPPAGGTIAFPPPQTVMPPQITCGGDASTLCELPQSVCADHYHMAYFTGGDCVDGVCQYEVHYMLCPLTCIGIGCYAAGT